MNTDTKQFSVTYGTPKKHILSSFLPLRMFLVLAVLLCLVAARLVAQPQQGVAPAAGDLQRRVERLETTQQSTVEALKTSLDSLRMMSESTKWLMVGFGALLSIIVGVQTTATFSTLRQERAARRREQEQYDWNKQHRDAWDTDNASGVTKINSVLAVIQNTLQARLDAEKTARHEAQQFKKNVDTLQRQLETIRIDLKTVKDDLADSHRTVANERELLEQEAKELANTKRHDFRHRVDALSAYAPKYDLFVGKYHHKKGDAEFQLSMRAQYIRAIAAHYGNEPALAEQLLKPLLTVSPSDPHERRGTVEGKRSAIASYFLGLIESNFANYEKAINYFDKSIGLEPAESDDDVRAEPHFKDVLSRIVAAEACAMSGNPGRTTVYLDQIHNCFDDAMAKCKRRNKATLPDYLLGLQGRASLVEVNMVLRQASDQTMSRAITILKDLLEKNPSYFSIVTYAQILMARDANSDEARKRFADAYTMIRNLNHLVEVTEIRSKILLLIVAGMSARHSPGFEGMWEHHLNSAIAQLKRLPKRDPVTCTVFSPFSKRNEAPDVIETQIAAFRERNVLLNV